MRTILAVVITWMLCSAALTEEGFVVAGPGAQSCAEFGLFYKKNPHSAELMVESWAQGFMSGINAERDSKGEPMRLIPPPDGEFSHIRRMCDEHPLLSVYRIILDYFQSLPEVPPSSK